MSSSIASPDGAAAPRWLRVLGNGIFLYPLLMHVLIVEGQLAAALIGLAAMSLVAALMSLQQSHGRWQALLYGLMSMSALIGLGSGTGAALYLPPVVFNLMFAVLFGRTLRPGQRPLIERFMRLHHGDALHPLGVAYARRLTWVWMGLFIGAASTSVALALFAPIEIWSLFANVINYVLIVALFIGQFVYGYARYPVLRSKRVVPLVMRMARRATRSGSLGH